MLFTNVTAKEKPDAVTIETLPEGRKRVLLTRNARKVTTEYDDGITDTTYVYDEVVFLFPEDQTPTKTGIKANLDAWWDYGSQPEETEPTLEERVEASEEAIAAIMDIIMGGEE